MARDVVIAARKVYEEQLEDAVQAGLQAWKAHVDTIGLKGGPGSGHWGHAGRPGKRGGSMPGSSYWTMNISADEYGDYNLRIRTQAYERGDPIMILSEEQEGLMIPARILNVNNDHPETMLALAVKEPSGTYRRVVNESEFDSIEPVGFQRPGARGHLVYHATHDEFVNNIRAFGLKKGREWMGRKPSVYFTADEEEALLLGMNFLGWDSKAGDGEDYTRGNVPRNMALVEFEIPARIGLRAIVDDYANNDFNVTSAMRLESHVPPSWIKRIRYIKFQDVNDDSHWDVDEIITDEEMKEATLTGYAIVLLYDDPPGEEVEKQLPIDDKSKQALLRLRLELFYDASDQLAEDVYTGRISIGQWQEQFKALIRGAHASAAAIGKGGWDMMGPRDWGALGTPVREQYVYLQGFANRLSDESRVTSYSYIRNRARMYGEAAIASAILTEAGFFFKDHLPWMPRDGSTLCLVRCLCWWELKVLERREAFTIVEATWKLSEAEHCDTCVDREDHQEVIRVPPDVDIPRKIGGF